MTDSHSQRRTDERTNLDRRCRPCRGRGTHRSTGRDGGVYVAEARGDADGDRCRRQGIARPERRSDCERRDLRSDGTQLTTSQAPGTVLGPVKAIVKALDLAGADLPLEGQLLVAAPGQIPAAQQAAVHRHDDPARDLDHGADRRGPDADGADVPRPAAQHAARARRTSRSACRRPTSRSGRPAVRRSARRSTAPSSRSTACSAPSRRVRGSPSGCRTTRASARRMSRDRHRPAAIAPGAVTLAAKKSGQGRR